MQIVVYLLVLAAGMGLSVEAGLLGPLGELAGHFFSDIGYFYDWFNLAVLDYDFLC